MISQLHRITESATCVVWSVPLIFESNCGASRRAVPKANATVMVDQLLAFPYLAIVLGNDKEDNHQNDGGDKHEDNANQQLNTYQPTYNTERS